MSWPISEKICISFFTELNPFCVICAFYVNFLIFLYDFRFSFNVFKYQLTCIHEMFNLLLFNAWRLEPVKVWTTQPEITGILFQGSFGFGYSPPSVLWFRSATWQNTSEFCATRGMRADSVDSAINPIYTIFNPHPLWLRCYSDASNVTSFWLRINIKCLNVCIIAPWRSQPKHFGGQIPFF